MHDLKFTDVAILPGEVFEIRDHRKPVTEEGLRHNAEVFDQNIDRILMSVNFPSLMVGLATELGETHVRACVAILGKPTIEKSDLHRVKELRAKFNELLVNRAAMFSGSSEAMNWKQSVGILEIALQNHRAKSAMLALYQNILVSAWTAFEVLASDLWESCLNARPRLGLVALNAEPSERDNEAEAERKRRTKFQVPAWFALEVNFDLHKSMGRLLRSTDKWDFARRNEARDAYLKVFENSETAIRAIFDDDKIGWLVALRNAIAHNAGNVDDDFRRLVKKHQTFSALKKDELIPIDGLICRELVSAVASKGAELVEFVDGWMIANKA